MEIFKLFGSILIDNDEANRSISKTEEKAEGLGGKFIKGIGTAAKWGAGIATAAVGAGAAIIGLSRPLIEAAAEAQAMNAQFEQVFGDLQSDAQKTIEGLGTEFGMLPNRIKPALTTMTSMFMGLGLETEEAMGVAERAVTAVADSAAFYDMSFEDANSALNSFIKGNYEGGEAIGLFANETQLASWASKELGLDWKTLDEAGKQVARLEFAESMQKAAGAAGQAARESNSYQNQLGNLKQAWEDLKAKFGEPILEPAVNMLAKLATFISNINVQPFIDGISNAFTVVVGYISNFKESVMSWIVSNRDSFESIKNTITTVLNVVVSFIQEKLSTIKQFWNENGSQIKQAVENLFNGIMAVVKFVMPAVLWLIEDIWGAIKNVINGVLKVIMGLIKTFSGLLTGDFSKMWEGIKQLFSGAVEAIWGLLQLGFLGKIFKVIKGFGEKGIDAIKNMASGIKGWFDDIVSAGKSKFDSLVDKILTPIRKARDGVKDAVDKIKGFFSSLTLKLPKIKLPSFKLENWSANPLDWVKAMPKIAIKWNAEGGIFTKPTIFNTANAGLQGVGEAGAEAILPLNDKTYSALANAIVNAMEQTVTGPSTIIVQSVLDSRVIGESVVDIVSGKQYSNANIKSLVSGVSL